MKQIAQTAGFFDTAEIFLLLGIFLATALFFLTIYFGLDKKKSYLFFFSYALFGALSLIFLLSAQPLPFLIASTFVNLSLLYFFAAFFNVSCSKTIAVFSLILILIAGINFKFAAASPKNIFFLIAWFSYALALMACSWISLRAIKNNNYAGKLLSAALVLTFFLIIVLLPESFFVSSIAVSSVLLIPVVTYTVLHDIKEQQALLKSLKIKAV